ncbi:hypothetical protein GCM10010401_12090 [Rarobacter faecitabidus]|uniref:Ribonuclease VapC n=1 Tax=Rarobacter faecitabidus TaxID=13243 RepID=A0A542ZNW8_RARFA|nr:PIN domain-containing protein [Rarobacter faecitabidus]TQL62053.1 putative nucleic acid-binding protein [Rarobacter faecitabidus]
MIVLDASVLFAFLESSDAHHGRAVAILRKVFEGRVLIHPLTLAEVLVGPARFGRAARIMDELLATGLEVVPQGAAEALSMAEVRAATRLKMPECCVLAAAISTGASLATFDEKLATAAAAAHVRTI